MKTTLDKALNKAKQIHDNKYDYSLIKSFNTMKDYWDIICQEHGVFKQQAINHINKKAGCHKCGFIKIGIGNKNNNNTYINKANIKHKNKYIYDKTIYTGSNNKVIITCPQHGDFNMLARQHINGSGCPVCSKESFLIKNRCPFEDYLKKVNNIHNNKYDYSKVVWKGLSNHIIVGCPRHGDFTIHPWEHTKRGCFKCKKEDGLVNHYHLTQEDFIRRHKEVHGQDVYDYSKTVYTKGTEPVSIICKIHGKYTYSCAKNYNGCYECILKKDINKDSNISKIVKDKIIVKHNKFIEKCKRVHDNIYDYSKTSFTKGRETITVTCPTHGDFKCKAYHHLRGRGCLICNIRYSNKALRWIKYKSITQNCYIQHIENEGEYSIPNTRYKADGYCKSINTIYEFHGTEYHGDPRDTDHSKNNHLGLNYGDLYLKTITKENIIKQQGFNLITIWEKDWDNIEKLNKSIRNHFIKKNKIVRKRVGNIIIKYVG